MRKIPKVFDTPTALNPGMEWVLKGRGTCHRLWDGQPTFLLATGVLLRHAWWDHGTPQPAGFLADGNSINGRMGGWLPLSTRDPSDEWHREALAKTTNLRAGYHWLVGPKVEGNRDRIPLHQLIPFFDDQLMEPRGRIRTYEGIKSTLSKLPWKGLLFAEGHPSNPAFAKVQRVDIGLPWPLPQNEGKTPCPVVGCGTDINLRRFPEFASAHLVLFHGWGHKAYNEWLKTL